MSKWSRSQLLFFLGILVVLVLIFVLLTRNRQTDGARTGDSQQETLPQQSGAPVGSAGVPEFGGIPVYFTDNVAAEATTPEVTTMEAALLNLINSAQTTLDVAIYDFNRDSIRDALIAANKRGVTVRVVADDEARYFTGSYIPYFQALEASGIQVRDDERENSIMHNKYLVFDQRFVWTGSTNMSDNGFTKNHNNSLILSSPEAAAIYLADFEQMWSGNFSVGKEPSIHDAITVEDVPVEIYFAPKDGLMERMLAAVAEAESSIDFAIFFFTDDALRAAIIAAHDRGVQVRGVWDVLGAASPFSDDEALCDAGIPIKVEDTIGKMHNKFMVIDAEAESPQVITGSMNWTGSGNDANDENLLLLQDGAIAQSYGQAFATLWAAIPTSFSCNMGASVGGEGDAGEGGVGESEASPIAVQILAIDYNPAGDDSAGERVILHNTGSQPETLTGWTLSDEGGRAFVFPVFTLGADEQVSVWVRSGDDDGENLFWNSRGPVWNNGGDTAVLLDTDGMIVDSCGYSGGGEREMC